MKAHSEITSPAQLTPAQALEILKEGNHRFLNNLSRNRNLLELVNETKDGQWPFAAILSCMDSRTSAELIFDQGLGDIFSIRVAGNVMSDDIVGSLEYATAIAGSKLILVLGHTGCGAIKGACDNVQFGNLTGLLAKIRPSVEQEQTHTADRNSNNAPFVNAVAEINVKNTVKDILRTSQVIRELVEKGEIGIASAMYDVSTGKVSIHEDEAIIFYKDKAALVGN
ncbi:MAG TPA: carbonic anhydrase family protein [Flavipsychrobacter sp.]|nr:carbonic anhydrase family protein [Flavipsychrobacter sp.]